MSDIVRGKVKHTWTAFLCGAARTKKLYCVCAAGDVCAAGWITQCQDTANLTAQTCSVRCGLRWLRVIQPAAQNIAWHCKGAEKIVLITDMIRPSGLPDGHYPQADGSEFIVSHNGTELRIPSGALAGSALTMERGLKNFTANAHATLEETWRCSSLNAAKLIGIDNETGSIEKGKLADLVLIDDEYVVCRTIIEGNTVYCK